MKKEVAVIRAKEDLLEHITTEPTSFRLYTTMGRFNTVSIKQDNESFSVTNTSAENQPTKVLSKEELFNEFEPHIKASKMVLFNKG